MMPRQSDGKSRTSPLSIGLWCLFLLAAIALVVANWRTIRSRNAVERSLAIRRAHEESIKEIFRREESLMEYADEIQLLRNQEAKSINSMLRQVQTVDDLQIKSDRIIWTERNRWLNKEGCWSVFFCVPEGKHKFSASAEHVPLVDWSSNRTDQFTLSPSPCQLDLQLEPHASYEFRLSHLESAKDLSKFRMELFDASGKLLQEKSFSVDAKYEMQYSRADFSEQFAWPREIPRRNSYQMLQSLESTNPVTSIFELSLPFSEDQNWGYDVGIKCSIHSDTPMVIDAVTLLKAPTPNWKIPAIQSIVPNEQHPNVLIIQRPAAQ